VPFRLPILLGSRNEFIVELRVNFNSKLPCHSRQHPFRINHEQIGVDLQSLLRSLANPYVREYESIARYDFP
jgi:hypothetical protein